MPVDDHFEVLFRRACARFATGITVTTVMGLDGLPQGLTANSFTSVSLDPPLVLVCVDRKASIHLHFVAARAFAVHVLDEGQMDLSVRFSTPYNDRFAGLDWQPGQLGAPLLEGTLAVLECEVRHQFEAGDHTIFLGEVKHAAWRDGAPLLYYASAYRHMA